jgi:hypothetical protein
MFFNGPVYGTSALVVTGQASALYGGPGGLHERQAKSPEEDILE